MGGKPDVDYVKFVIKPPQGNDAVALWFGGMAFAPQPRAEQLARSVETRQARLVGPEGKQNGLDTRGKTPEGRLWRHFGFGSEGAEYENVSEANARLFDAIIESACITSYPAH